MSVAAAAPGAYGAFSVSVREEAFDLGVEVARLRAFPEVALAAGAIASFVGTVRAADPGAGGPPIEALTLEHYPGMTERAIRAMLVEAQRRFPLLGARVIHRVGRLEAGEGIVLVVTASSHRRAAFEGCEFLMDWLKTQAPFWKKESTPEGERWVDARVEDDTALARWGIAATNASPSSVRSATPASATMGRAADGPAADDPPPAHR
jgi:molybdopterin synthase catalytic subunit